VAARSLLDELGVTGLPAVSDPDGRLAVSWGAQGVPETFLVGRDGTIRAFQAGPISPEWVQQYVDPLVAAP
jgi:cytochrome c biogenesis protein CcmG, thiol:disulfide interchange protein DsbE